MLMCLCLLRLSSLPTCILTPRSLLTAAASVKTVVAGPRPGTVAHLRLVLMLLLLLLLHLLLKAHGRHCKRHHRMWRESPVHGWRPHLHGDAVLSRGHEAVGGGCHGHPWECHGCSRVHAVHGMHCSWHSQAWGEGWHGGTPRTHHCVWHPLHHLQSAVCMWPNDHTARCNAHDRQLVALCNAELLPKIA